MKLYFQALRNVVIYIVLSPYDNEQADLIARVSENVHLEELTSYK